MFRKHNGLVEVAVFVYRIIQDLPGGLVDGPDDGYLYPGASATALGLDSPGVVRVAHCLVTTTF